MFIMFFGIRLSFHYLIFIICYSDGDELKIVQEKDVFMMGTTSQFTYFIAFCYRFE